MRERAVRALGMAAATSYAAFIVWLYVRQPQTVAEVTGGLSASIAAYRINQQAFADGCSSSARISSRRRAPPSGAPIPPGRTRALSSTSGTRCYRQGWRRLYSDDELFARGLEHVNQAIALAHDGRIVVDDADLQMRSADELKAELEAGLRSDVSDLNPLRVFRPRK